MEMDVFARKVCKAVGEGLGRGFHIEVKDVRKNNGVILHGMLVTREGQNVAPTIYLDTFLNAYESGTPFEAIVRKLLGICREDALQHNRVDMGFFQSFEKVRDRICYRLVGREKNGVLLGDMPYVEFLDMAISFYYAYQGDALGDGSISIHNSHMDIWGTDTAELLALAECNTGRLFPWECRTLEEVLDDKEGRDDGMDVLSADGRAAVPLKILSNDRKIYGACCMLYPGVLEGLAEKEGHSLYILPSSVHETILLPDDGGFEPDRLRRMVSEVNRTEVAAEEVLTDSLYYYDMQKKGIVMA